jgi:nitric oxide reductase NorQ protein
MDPRDACLAALVEPLTDDAETIAALAEVIDATLV